MRSRLNLTIAEQQWNDFDQRMAKRTCPHCKMNVGGSFDCPHCKKSTYKQSNPLKQKPGESALAAIARDYVDFCISLAPPLMSRPVISSYVDTTEAAKALKTTNRKICKLRMDGALTGFRLGKRLVYERNQVTKLRADLEAAALDVHNASLDELADYIIATRIKEKLQ